MDVLAISFPPFRLDLHRGCLLRGEETIPLRRRTWEVLCYLAKRPGRLVSKDELIDAVWADTTVSEVTLSTSIRELRIVLGDDARSPRFVETVHRRGFRFVASTSTGVASAGLSVEILTAKASRRAVAAPRLVGRDTDLAMLHEAFELARAETPSMVFVRGEAGIGKTSLIRSFLASLPVVDAPNGVLVSSGQCGRFLHGSPPFHPFVEAIETMASSPAGDGVLAALDKHTPEILDQLPWLREKPTQARTTGSTERRDTASRLLDALVEVSQRTPLVLLLEDLHDADASTIELLGRIAGTDRRAMLLILGSYRGAEAILDNPPLVALARSASDSRALHVLDLDLLAPADVSGWLRGRDAACWTAERCHQVYRQSGGNALFMVAIAESMEIAIAEGLSSDDFGVPDSLHALLRAQLRGLDRHQREVLAAASIEGEEFSSLGVSVALDLAIEEVEVALESLASSGRFVRRAGMADWPSGGVGQAYSFLHELYRRALYDAQPSSRRAALHRRIAEGLEVGFAGATLGVASRLADHYERGGDRRKAIVWLRESASVARARFAHREALRLLDGALELLALETSWNEHDQWEFRVHVDRTASISAVHGQGAVEVRSACERAETLGRDLEASVERFFNLLLLFQYRMIRSEVQATASISEEMARMAIALDAPLLRLGAVSCVAMTQTTRGDFEDARRNFAVVLAEVPREFRLSNFRDVLVPSMTGAAQNLCYLGDRSGARTLSRQAIERSDWLEDHFERSCSRVYEAYCSALFGDREATAASAAAGGAIARDHGIDEMIAIADILEGWAVTDTPPETRLSRIRGGIEGLDRTGHLVGKGFYLALLAEAELDAGDPAAAYRSLDVALEFSRSTGSLRHAAEICRLLAVAAGTAGKSDAAARRWEREARRIATAQGNQLVLRRLAGQS